MRRISLISLSLSFCRSHGSSSHGAGLVSIFCCFLAWFLGSLAAATLCLLIHCWQYILWLISTHLLFVVAGKHTFATRMGQTAGRRLPHLSKPLVSCTSTALQTSSTVIVHLCYSFNLGLYALQSHSLFATCATSCNLHSPSAIPELQNGV